MRFSDHNTFNSFSGPEEPEKDYWRVNLLQQCELTKLSEDYLG